MHGKNTSNITTCSHGKVGEDLCPTICDVDRLKELYDLGLVDAPAEEAFDRITRIAANFLDVPVALVSAVTDTRQFFKSRIGLPEPWNSKRETPLTHSFCKHVVGKNEPLIVNNAPEHDVVRNNLAIRDLGVMAYLGFPLKTAEGKSLGSFCVIDSKPRIWTEREIEVVRDLAFMANGEIDLRNEVLKLRATERNLEIAADELLEAKQQAEKLALVARYTDNAVAITNKHFRIEWINEGFTRITKYDLADVARKNPIDFLRGPETSRATVEHMREALSRDSGFDVEIVQYTKIGEPFWSEVEVRPICDQFNRITHFIALTKDITQRKLAETEREQLRKELMDASHKAGMAELATGVLHNVGNVLNSINVSTGLLLKNATNSAVPKLRAVSDLIAEHSDDLAGFVGESRQGKLLPEFIDKLATRLESEKTIAEKELSSLQKNVEHVKEVVAAQQTYARNASVLQNFDVCDLLEDVIKATDPTLNRNNIEIARHYSCRPEASTDKHKVFQILVNLVSNAIDSISEFQPEQGVITLHVAQADHMVSIEVSDNGVGIPHEAMKSLFQHGYSTKETGHGFGLHSSGNSAKSIGGELVALSEGVGQGATFRLTFPMRLNGKSV